MYTHGVYEMIEGAHHLITNLLQDTNGVPMVPRVSEKIMTGGHVYEVVDVEWYLPELGLRAYEVRVIVKGVKN